jgi:TP901 family phage tail tape measure protein
MATAAELILKIEADVKSAQAGIESVRKSLHAVQKEAHIAPSLNLETAKQEFSKGIADIKSKFQEGFSNVGSGVIGEVAKNLGTLINPAGAAIAAITAIGGALVEGTQRALEFEKGLANLSVITGVSGGELEALGDKAKELALRFGGDATSQLDLMSTALSKLGPDLAKNQEQFAGFVENVNIFAKATGQDAATAGQQLMDVMLQVGVNTSDANEVLRSSGELMDVLAKAAQEGASETADLAESYLQVGSTAKQLNLSATQVSAALEGLAFAGKTGAEAGVGLRNVLTSLVKTSSMAEKALNTIGLSSAELGKSLSERGIADTLQMLQDGLAKLGNDADRSAVLVRVFGKENLAAAGGLLNNLDKIRELQKRIESGAQGAALQQAQTRMATMGEMLERLKTAAGLVLEAMGNQVLRIANMFAGAFSGLQGGAEGVVRTISQVMSSLVSVLQPIITTVAGAANLIVSVISSLAQGMRDALSGLSGEGVDVLGAISSAMQLLLSVVTSAVSAVAKFVGLIVGGAIRQAVNLYNALSSAVRTVVTWASELITKSTFLQGIFLALKSYVQSVIDSFVSLYNWLKKLIGGQDDTAKKNEQVAQSQQQVAEATKAAASEVKKASTDYAALAAQLDAIAQRAKQYVDAVKQYVDLAAKQSALNRGIVSPDTQTQIEAARIQLDLLQQKLLSFARTAGVEKTIQSMLADPLNLSAEAAQHWAEEIAKANPIVAKAQEEMQAVADASDDNELSTEKSRKAQEKYQQALSKAKGEALSLLNEVIKLRQQSQELEIRAKVETTKQQLEKVSEELSKLSDVTIEVALDNNAVETLRSKFNNTINDLRTRLQSLQPGSDEANVVKASLEKIVSSYEKFNKQLADKTAEGAKLRSDVQLAAIRDDAERDRQERLRRLDEEEQEWIRKAQLVQAGEETIRAIRERYSSLRQQLMDTEAQRWQQVNNEMLRTSDSFLTSLTNAFGTAFVEVGKNAQEGMKNFNRAIASALIDLLEAMLPAWIAGATGAEVGTKGIIGFGTAGILIAVLKTLFAAARAALQRGFEVGGFTGYGDTQGIAGVVHHREYVIRYPYAERYRAILDAMNKGAYSPSLVMVPTVQQVRVELTGALQVRAKGDWIAAQRSVALRARMAS